MTWITTIFSFISNFFGYLTGRSALRNAADVKERAKIQDKINEEEKLRKIIADRDLEALRKELSD